MVLKEEYHVKSVFCYAIGSVFLSIGLLVPNQLSVGIGGIFAVGIGIGLQYWEYYNKK